MRGLFNQFYPYKWTVGARLNISCALSAWYSALHLMTMLVFRIHKMKNYL